MKKESWNTVTTFSVDRGRTALFEETVLPHLDAAYNLARWLTRNEHDAQDVVQEAYLRALNSFHSFQRGRDGRPWLLKIVRNTCYTWLRHNRPQETIPLSEETYHETVAPELDPESMLLQKADSELLRDALGDVQLEYREALVLREMEGFSYKEIAELLSVPVGTVMSRLSRGRRDLWRSLRAKEERSKQ